MKKAEQSNRQAQAAETRKKIYENAAQLFRSHGIDNISVDKIVETSGVSKGTFYVHFDSKDALIASLVSDYVKNLDLDYKAFLDSFPSSAKASDILTAFVEKIAETIADFVGYDLMRITYEVQLARTADMDSVMGYNRDIYKMFNYIIALGVQQDEFRKDMSVDMISKHCMLALRGLTYEWCIRYPSISLKEQTLEHFELLLAGIKKP